MPTSTSELRAPAISCNHCVNAIKRAVGAMPGVQSVDASAATKVVTVTYDPAVVAETAIRATMADEGYPVAN